MFQGFVSPGVEQLVYVVVHEWFQVQEHNLYCSGMVKIVAVCVTALACSVVMFENKDFYIYMYELPLTLCILCT